MTAICLFGKSTDMTDLHDHLRTAGKRPAALAKELGVTPSTITRILRGERKPSVDLARRISQATGLSVDVLRPDIFGAGT